MQPCKGLNFTFCKDTSEGPRARRDVSPVKQLQVPLGWEGHAHSF